MVIEYQLAPFGVRPAASMCSVDRASIMCRRRVVLPGLHREDFGTPRPNGSFDTRVEMRNRSGDMLNAWESQVGAADITSRMHKRGNGLRDSRCITGGTGVVRASRDTQGRESGRGASWAGFQS